MTGLERAGSVQGARGQQDRTVLRLRVAHKQFLSRDVVGVTLASTGPRLPAWTAGAHVTLMLPSGLERQYSLCGPVDDAFAWRIAVLREPDSRGGSSYVHDELEVGDVLEVRAPRNNFPLANARRYVFVAGGIGITPFIPMLAEADRAGAEWDLHYGARDAASFSFADVLREYGTHRVHLVAQDCEGVLDLDAILGALAPGTQVYCCGPEGLLQAVEQRASGWPPDMLHLERFAPVGLGDDVADKPITVHLKTSGVRVEVEPAESILDAMVRHRIDAPSSCREGTCGTCETRVLSGTPDHRDSVLTPAEQAAGDYMMICVSRALGPEIELDA
ncbi:PDR/VanB family oxidoreductase [Saccharopolyspora mangrovi]|uniref:PDR/VanB family oxidoreductase n=1 Tax=Saccharopolyspora mangrovi TaxID=3082379 RepID=A0ABU6AG36_9PSEU|nr:PDR/VanB family oxidoreductase [Saccharopolyspora sp. S2-29]MEB3370510.1 PDR/VanB family oxidoreductase [Saccharopolyspora sp. S2-29]